MRGKCARLNQRHLRSDADGRGRSRRSATDSNFGRRGAEILSLQPTHFSLSLCDAVNKRTSLEHRPSFPGFNCAYFVEVRSFDRSLARCTSFLFPWPLITFREVARPERQRVRIAPRSSRFPRRRRRRCCCTAGGRTIEPITIIVPTDFPAKNRQTASSSNPL